MAVVRVMRLRDHRPMQVDRRVRHHQPPQGGGSMRTRISNIPWRRLLYTGATLATFVLAAGAKWRPGGN